MTPEKPANSGQLINNINTEFSSSGKLKQLIEIFKEVLKLENEIFLFPIELKTLIPDYYKTLNPNYVTEYQSRVLKLMKKIEQIENFHWDMKNIVKQETVFVVLDRIINNGNVPIGLMKDWVAKGFPNHHPQRTEARKVATEMLKWYLDLFEAWDAILEKD